MASMPLVRAALSILVGAVVAASGVLASSTAQTSDTSPAGFTVPPIHVGDQGKYRSGEAELAFRFDQEEFAAANGAMRRTLVLTAESEGRQTRHWIEGDVPVAVQVSLGGGGSGSGTSVGNVSVLGLAFYHATQTVYGGGQEPFCGLLVQILPATGRAPGCGDGLDEIKGSPGVYQSPQARVTLSPTLPVASHVVSGAVEWELVAFQRGAAPFAPAGPGTPTSVAFAPGRVPDEAGSNHPFPLSRALLLAVDLPVPNALNTFLRDHQGAYLASAAFQETVEPAQRTHAWTLVAFDGADQVAVVVEQTAPQADDPPVTLQFGTGLQVPTLPVPVVSEVPAPDRPYPAPSADRPPFATLASLEARWTAAAPPSARLDGVNAYGFDILCGSDCSHARTETWIGIDRIRSHQLPQPPICLTLACDYNRWVWVVERLAVDDSGATVSRMHSDWILYDEASGPIVGPLVVGEERQQAAPPAHDHRGEASMWFAPSGAVAAGAGLLGLLSAAVCYLWPQLKGALLAIWRPTRDHPTRERLKAAIAAEPGIHFHALRRLTGIAAGTLRHHLRVLEQEGVIVAHAAAGFRCFTLARGTARSLGTAAPALKSASARRILEGVVRSPPLTMQAAAELAGLDPSTATHHVQRLHEAGLVTRQRSGRSIHLMPTRSSEEALAAF